MTVCNKLATFSRLTRTDKILKKNFLGAACVLTTVLLTACGGGGSGAVADVFGTAATGAPLADATVSLLCANGGSATTATTSAAGKYGMTLPAACAAPYFLKATGTDTTITPPASITLYAIADAKGNINITPLTDLAAGFATGGNTAAEYAAVLAASKTTSSLWSSTSAADAKAQLQALLSKLGISTAGITDLLNQAFEAQAGDKLDDLLEALKSKRGGVSLEALVESETSNGGSPGKQPWKTLFPAGASTLTFTASDCTASTTESGEQATLNFLEVTSAVITLTKGTSTVSLAVVPKKLDGADSASAPEFTAVTVGAATGGGSNFQLRAIDGGSGYVLPIFSASDANGNQNVSFGYAPLMANPAAASSQSKDTGLALLSSQDRAASQVSISNSSAARQTFSYEAGDTGTSISRSLFCRHVSTPFTSTALNNFHPQARTASIIAGTPTAIVSSAVTTPNGCPLAPSGTYTYEVTPLGEAFFDGVGLPASWLDRAGANGYYSELSYFNALGLPASSSVSIVADSFLNKRVQMSRGSASFGSSCGDT